MLTLSVKIKPQGATGFLRLAEVTFAFPKGVFLLSFFSTPTFLIRKFYCNVCFPIGHGISLILTLGMMRYSPTPGGAGRQSRSTQPGAQPRAVRAGEGFPRTWHIAIEEFLTGAIRKFFDFYHATFPLCRFFTIVPPAIPHIGSEIIGIDFGRA